MLLGGAGYEDVGTDVTWAQQDIRPSVTGTESKLMARNQAI